MHAHMVHLECDTQGVFGSESDTLIVSWTPDFSV